MQDAIIHRFTVIIKIREALKKLLIHETQLKIIQFKKQYGYFKFNNTDIMSAKFYIDTPNIRTARMICLYSYYRECMETQLYRVYGYIANIYLFLG